ncbi:acyltransferase [Blastococcus sp. TML/C7B]|uniref:acyltransferase family protein n=1 Tax=Blastococcus sp. TML/C7B TaxID=2798728 RepID=UPI00190B255F|nr:acyltransferase [Blastococcus sp. TML/C7B]MBN1096093.1 acyltransferase [Blastococcus sp. TML/C7B]
MTASALLDGGPAAAQERAFPALDGLRILAATAIVVSHVAFITGTSSSDTGIGASALAHLEVGVPVFFVLSGFLLFRPFPLAAVRGDAAPDTRAYLWRRALRILPTYWLTVIGAVLFLPVNEGTNAGKLLQHLALVQVYGDEGPIGGLDQMWSLCTEVAFYAVLPVLAAGLGRLSRGRAARPWPALLALGGLAVAGPLFLYLVRLHPWGYHPMHLWLPSFAGWFAGGMALALLSVADRGWAPVRVVRALGRHLVVCWAAAAVLYWVACTPLSGPYTFAQPTPVESVTRNVLYMGIAVLVVLPLVLGQEHGGLVRRALSGATARRLGEVSYGVFLVHMPLLAGFYAWLEIPVLTGPPIPVFVIVWGASVAIAACLYVAVERPVRRFRSLVPDHGRTPRAEPAVHPAPGDLAVEPTK